MNEVTSRERIRLSLNHQEPDMVPIDFGAMRSTGINAVAYNELKRYLGIGYGETRVYDIFQQLAEPEACIADLFGADVVQLHRYEPAFGINISRWKDGKLNDGSSCLVPEGYTPVENEKGEKEIRTGSTVIARMPAAGLYYDLVYHPYADAKTMQDVDSVPLASITDTELDFLKVNAEKLHKTTDKAVLASFGGNILEAAQADWGYETSFINMAADPELMHYYFDRITRQYIEDLGKYLGAVAPYIDIIQMGDDLGTQESLQISVKMYRDLIKPYHTRIYRYVRDNYPGIKVFLHSCGAVSELIGDLIEAGIDILNPVQLSAKGMDPVNLKKNYGKHITFWGGGVDTQTTLTNGSIGDIKREVKEMMEIFSPGGGYVFTQVHNIQPNISPEKITAVYKTAQKYRNY